MKNIFTNIYEKNSWGSNESVSGDGSTLASTAIIRTEIPKLLEELNATSILDLPCGDFNWMSKVDLSGISYTGGDLVEALVQSNTEKYAKNGVDFKVLDVCNSTLPYADLVLCRDCLVHLPIELIKIAIENIKLSGAKWLLTTHFENPTYNMSNIQIGAWRPISLDKAPFDLTIEKIIIEGCKIPGFTDKSLALIRLND